MAEPQLYLGCPVWACEAWKGSVFTAKAARHAWLTQYSVAFQTVEGNSTFYALPNLDTAKRWAESVQPGFKFALKVPRLISHDLRLEQADDALKDFLLVAELLHEHDVLGPSFLQLPPDYSPRNRQSLEKFLRALPRYLPWAVEVRHEAWFDGATHEMWLDSLLTELGIDKVIFDSRPLYSMPASDVTERAAQHRKPKTPVRETVTGKRPFLRLIGRNRIEDVQKWIDMWAPVISNWVEQGLKPFVFTHAPDDRFAPEFARALHRAIQAHFPALSDPPQWPGEVEHKRSNSQMELF